MTHKDQLLQAITELDQKDELTPFEMVSLRMYREKVIELDARK